MKNNDWTQQPGAPCRPRPHQLVSSTLFKNISQIGSSPQVRLKIRNVWNHQLVYVCSPAAMSSSRWITLLRLTSFTWANGGMKDVFSWLRRIIDHWDWASIRSFICPAIDGLIQSFKHAFINSGPSNDHMFHHVHSCYLGCFKKRLATSTTNHTFAGIWLRYPCRRRGGGIALQRGETAKS